VTPDNVPHNWSDAWLLLAIIYADKQGGATLDKIIAAGDAINVAVFSPTELESGLARLTGSAFIEENAGQFVPTKKAQLQTKLGNTRRSMHNELKDVAKLLGCPGAIDDQPSQDNLRYPGFSISVYEDAVETYRRSVQSVV
jgi:hypothetical protein